MPSLFLILFSLLTALAVGVLPENKTQTARQISLFSLSLQSFAGLFLLADNFIHFGNYVGIDKIEKFAYLLHYEWFSIKTVERGTISVNLLFGLDGINTALLVISLWVLTLAAFISKSIKQRERSYYALLMILSATVTGAFSSLDFVLFFIFFEFMLVPMYLLIAVWGGAKREYAGVKFFIYTFVGSLLILVSGIYLGTHCLDPVLSAKNLGINASSIDEIRSIFQAKAAKGFSAEELKKLVFTFSLADMADSRNFLNETGFFGNFSSLRPFIFWAILIGFGIKLPVFPLHTWLPDAHTEAATPVSVILAGILLKFGGYGLLRIGLLIFPDIFQAHAGFIAAWGAFSLLYGSFAALGQTHFKRLIAYSSIAHMGFIFIGLAAGNAEGVGGAIYQMFSHAILSPMLFIIAGILSERSHHHLEIRSFGGLYNLMPTYGAFAALAFLASMGMPFFCGFAGEFFVLLGAAASPHISVYVWLTVLAGMLTGAGYAIYTYRRLFLGKLFLRTDMPEGDFFDIKTHEKVVLVLMTAAAFLFGIYPKLLWQGFEGSLLRMAALAH